MTQISVNYNEAIQYYQDQKELFLQYYSQQAGIDSANAEQDFLNKITQELNSESLDDEFQKAMSLLGDLATTFSNKELLKKYRDEAQSLATEKKMLANQIVDAITEELVSTQDFFSLVQESLKTYGEGFCSRDVLKSARSYIRALVKQRIVQRGSHNPKIKDRASKMKGYYREGLAYKALSRILYHFGENPPIEILSQGEKNTEIDTLIKFNPLFFSEIISETIGDGVEFGMQEKSWRDPWTKEGLYPSLSDKAAIIYSVGSRNDLLKHLNNKKSWIAGVNYLGQTNNIKSAIGSKNVLYLTGSNFYFTADLISQMRRQAYYLAFVFSPKEYEATSKITWQQRIDHVRWIQSFKK